MAQPTGIIVNADGSESLRCDGCRLLGRQAIFPIPADSDADSFADQHRREKHRFRAVAPV